MPYSTVGAVINLETLYAVPNTRTAGVVEDASMNVWPVYFKIDGATPRRAQVGAAAA